MCEAVSKAVSAFRDFAREEDRQMALIFLTDENGAGDATLP